MKNVKAGIVDYGAGNTASVKNTLKSIGVRSIISSQQEELEKCELIIIPGVGSYNYAMKELKNRGLTEFLKRWSMNGKGLIGICLGMQILTEVGYEGGEIEGLGIIEGKTIAMSQNKVKTGWDRLRVEQRLKNNDWIKDSELAYFYFNHSYRVQVDKRYIVAFSGQNNNVPSVIKRRNVIGLQFHPEKSQGEGRRLLYNAVLEVTNEN